MKQLLFAILAGVALTSCEMPEDPLIQLQKKLPAGCTLTDVGEYGRVRAVLVVLCDGRQVATTNSMVRSGKLWVQNTTVTIQ